MATLVLRQAPCLFSPPATAAPARSHKAAAAARTHRDDLDNIAQQTKRANGPSRGSRLAVSDVARASRRTGHLIQLYKALHDQKELAGYALRHDKPWSIPPPVPVPSLVPAQRSSFLAGRSRIPLESSQVEASRIVLARPHARLPVLHRPAQQISTGARALQLQSIPSSLSRARLTHAHDSTTRQQITISWPAAHPGTGRVTARRAHTPRGPRRCPDATPLSHAAPDCLPRGSTEIHPDLVARPFEASSPGALTSLIAELPHFPARCPRGSSVEASHLIAAAITPRGASSPPTAAPLR